MVIDLGALVRALEEDPQQRAALRAAVFGDQPDLASALAELAQAQARTELRVEELAQAQARTDARLDELAKEVRALAAAQRTTEDSLKALVDVVSGIQDRLGKLDGDSLERRYRERGQAYLAPIARRLRLVDSGQVGVLVDDAERAGTLTASQSTSLLNADAVFVGRRRSDDESVHLVVEASVTIARHDVRRARERADLLTRLVDTPVMAVVAGEFAPEPVLVASQDAEVWCVTNGRAVAPTDDLDDLS